MSRMSELIYPDAPGFKTQGPSQQAAKAISSTAATLRAQVLNEFKQHQAGRTADEIATSLNLSVLSVRPRVSELRRLGKIEQTGSRRTNESGMTATVWRLSSSVPGPKP